MSWSLNVALTPREDFAAAVDAADVGGQDVALPGVAEQVAAARAAMKALSAHVTRPLIGGSAGGHCLQEGEGAGMYDGVSASVYGGEPDPVRT